MLSANNSMISDKFSCIKEITKVVPIALSTAYQGNEITGISNILDSWKRQYIPQLQGVVVSYKDISLMSKYAYIKSDYPIIHCNVNATFVLFVPVTGSIVKGKINRISHNYIGCLVHSTINVAVHRSVNEVDDSHFIALDQEILFEITDLNFKRKIVRVKGKITQECIKLMGELQMFTPETDNTSSHLNSLISSSDEDSEKEHENNPDSGLESENQSQSLLRNNVNLFSSDVNDLTFAPPKKKKKKSHRHQTESSPSRSLDSLDAENEDESQSLLSSYNKESILLNSVQVNPTSPKKKRKKTSMEKKKTLEKSFTSFSSNENSSNAIVNKSLHEDNTTDSSYCSPKKKKSQSSSTKSTNLNSVISNSTSPKKKRKKAVKDTEEEKFLDKPSLFNMNESGFYTFNNDSLKEDNTTDSSFSSPKKKKSKPSTPEPTVINSVNCYSASPKKKTNKGDKKRKKEELFQKSFTSFNLNENSINAFTNNSIKEDNTTDTGYNSPKKKKNKPSFIDSLEESLTLNSSLLKSMFTKEDSTDTSSHLSSSSKKKKHKKSKENLLNSPSLFSDSLSSSKEDSTPFKVPKTPKKKHKRSEDKVSTLETTFNEKNPASLELNKDIKPEFHLSESLKSDVKEERCSEKEDNFMDFLSAFDPISENQSLSNSIKEEPLVSNEKAKKRKLELSDNEGLTTKKRKTSEKKNKSDKSSSKSKSDKLKKKSKGKSKKDSKKDKKKKKVKVISSKKKLPKLKKEKKEKGKKSKKNKSKKSSKEKKISMS